MAANTHARVSTRRLEQLPYTASATAAFQAARLGEHIHRAAPQTGTAALRTCCTQLLHALQAAGAVWCILHSKVHHVHLRGLAQWCSCGQVHCCGNKKQPRSYLPVAATEPPQHLSNLDCMQPQQTTAAARQQGRVMRLACEGSPFIYSSPCSSCCLPQPNTSAVDVQNSLPVTGRRSYTQAPAGAHAAARRPAAAAPAAAGPPGSAWPALADPRCSRAAGVQTCGDESCHLKWLPGRQSLPGPACAASRCNVNTAANMFAAGVEGRRLEAHIEKSTSCSRLGWMQSYTRQHSCSQSCLLWALGLADTSRAWRR